MTTGPDESIGIGKGIEADVKLKFGSAQNILKFTDNFGAEHVLKHVDA